ncbi:AAA family ATPase [Chengkuizengella axinellae]|uniref:MoxR family ATPase n=1 Tax=Chengkuizengella axinellae TaxID=3064388 RepID=A0ABT9J1I2_9BACL|nr:MoxR family ATPase [Chengkuizengella sp. 2205SS18-9]MDP5274875.1 MoxR family ATPase [Chengkuizengella sp. 2205SS18-9]
MNTRDSSSFLYEQPQEMIEKVIQNIERVIIGKREAVEKVLIAFISQGHVLIEDIPGVGKTMLVRALAKSIDCSFNRIQFTPDLLPTDITGISMYNQKTRDFEFRPGPLMSNIVLADEINRTSAKTQSALLEAMAERSLTVDGMTYKLPNPFLILATQNPFEYEGTYVLPEAQMDRFSVRIQLGYPSKTQEVTMLERVQKVHPIKSLKAVLFKEELIELQKKAREIHVDAALREYIVQISKTTRHHPHLQLGVSPRASIDLMKAAQSLALIRGRTYVVPDDIKELILPVFAHRIVLKQNIEMTGLSTISVLTKIKEELPIPTLKYVSLG